MMKIVILFFSLFLGLVAMSQERTVNLKLGEGTYYKYIAGASDVLIPTTGDTIDLVFQYTGQGYIKKIALKSRFDMRTTADTTVAVSLFGKEFADDPTYVEIIASTVSGAVTANNTVLLQTSDYTEVMVADTAGLGGTLYQPVKDAVFTPLDKSYRFYRVRYILQGNDSVGTGIKLDEIELKLYTD